jgi:hypothetical protein
MTSEDYNFYSLVANALSAAGTFFASVVALYLAVRQTKLQQKEMVKIEIEIAKQANVGGVIAFIDTKHFKEDYKSLDINDLFLRISIYNIGFKNITVKAIAIESKENLDTNYISGAAFNEHYENIKIESGDMLYRTIKLTSIINSQHVISQYKKLKKPKKTLYVNVNTNMCGVFRQKLPNKFHELMAEKISKEIE